MVGNKYPYENDANIPNKISEMYRIPKVESSVCLEGGELRQTETDLNGGGNVYYK